MKAHQERYKFWRNQRSYKEYNRQSDSKGGDLGGYDIAVEETADEDTQGQSGE